MQDPKDSSSLTMANTPSTIDVGNSLKVGGRFYTVTKLLDTPKVVMTYTVTHTNSSGSSYTDSYDVYGRRCMLLAEDNITEYFLELYFWSGMRTLGTKFRKRRAKAVGDIEEPKGTAVLTLETIKSTKQLKGYNLCYLWRVEWSLDPKGEAVTHKQKFADYIRTYVKENTTITLKGGHCYHVEAFLSAEGAFGTVFKATHLNTGRLVVLKFQEAKPALNEAMALATLGEHRGIVAFGQVSEVIGYEGSMQSTFAENPLRGQISIPTQRGRLNQVNLICVVAEFVDGHTVEQLVKKRPRFKPYDWLDYIPGWGRFGFRGLGLNEAMAYAEQLCDAVDYIHRQGYIHLDIKPTNIMVNRQGCLQIVDMGSITRIGKGIFALGQGNHAAPEVKEHLLNHQRAQSIFLETLFSSVNQAVSSPPVPQITAEKKALREACIEVSKRAYRSISISSDVFSVAAVCFSMVVGEHPRQIGKPSNSEPTQVDRIFIHNKQFSLRRRLFKSLFERAMNVRAEERFQTCYALKQTLQRTYSNVVKAEFFAASMIFLFLIYLVMRLPLQWQSTTAQLLTALLALPLVGWIIQQFRQKHMLSSIESRRYSLATVPLVGLNLILAVSVVSFVISNLVSSTAISLKSDTPDALHIVTPIATKYRENRSPTATVESVETPEKTFQLALTAIEENEHDLAQRHFQTFLTYYQNELDISLTQIQGFDKELTNKLVPYAIENPREQLASQSLIIASFIEPWHFHIVKEKIGLYKVPEKEGGIVGHAQVDDWFFILELVETELESEHWYQVWYKQQILYVLQGEIE